MRFHGNIIGQDVQFYFRDISDHVKRINHAIDGMREMLTAAMQAYLAMVTVGQNEVVKRLAGWGCDIGGSNDGFQPLWHELQEHARIGLALRLPGGYRPLGLGLRLATRKVKKGWLVIDGNHSLTCVS